MSLSNRDIFPLKSLGDSMQAVGYSAGIVLLLLSPTSSKPFSFHLPSVSAVLALLLLLLLTSRDGRRNRAEAGP